MRKSGLCILQLFPFAVALGVAWGSLSPFSGVQNEAVGGFCTNGAACGSTGTTLCPGVTGCVQKFTECATAVGKGSCVLLDVTCDSLNCEDKRECECVFN
jgi:hypothetical protein